MGIEFRSINLTNEFQRDFARMVIAAIGGPTPEKALALVKLGIGTALFLGVDIEWLANFCHDTIFSCAEKILAGEDSLLDPKFEPKRKPGGSS